MAQDKDDRLKKQKASKFDVQEIAGQQAQSEENEQFAEELPPQDMGERMDAAKAYYRSMVGQDEQTNFAAGNNCSTCENLEAQLVEAIAKATELENLYKRMAADFDNFRKRTEREREELLGLGVQKAIEAILPAVDDLERAQASLTPESTSRNIVESLKLIYNRIGQCLTQLGIKPLEAVGQPFDPKLHEPVQQIETNELPEGHVVHDLRRGYIMNDKVIRPTLVNVATSTGSHPVSQEDEESEENLG